MNVLTTYCFSSNAIIEKYLIEAQFSVYLLFILEFIFLKYQITWCDLFDVNIGVLQMQSLSEARA